MADEKLLIKIFANDGTRAAFSSVGRNIDKVTKQGTAMKKSLLGGFRGVASGATLASAGLINLRLQFEQIEKTAQFATGSLQAGTEAFNFAREEAYRLGLDVRATAQSYAQFAAAAKGTALEGEGTRKIFSAVSQAATVLQLSAHDTRGALRALEQMISKGNVQAEELRQQLGERLPGAFQIAARAMGVTTQELNDMLENGEVLAEDLLPKMADELNKTFGSSVQGAAKSLRANLQRMTGELEILANFASMPLAAFVSQASRGVAQAIKPINDTLENMRVEGLEEDIAEANAEIQKQTAFLEEARAVYDEMFARGADRSDLEAKMNQIYDARNKLIQAENKLLSAGILLQEKKDPKEGVYGPPIDEKQIEKLKKEFEKLSSRINQSVLTPQEEMFNKIAEAQDLIGRKGGISLETYTKYVKDLAEAVSEGLPAFEEAEKAFRRKAEAVDEANAIVARGLTEEQALRNEIEQLNKTFTDGDIGAELYASAIRVLGLEMANLNPEIKEAEELFDSITSTIDQSLSPTERYAKTIREFVEEALRLQAIEPDKFEALGGMEEIQKAVEGLAEGFGKGEKEKGKGGPFESLIGEMDIVFNRWDEGMDGMVDAFARALQEMAAKALAEQLTSSLGGLFGAKDGGGGGILSAIGGFFGGGKARGGTVMSNRAYLVGEKGPELLYAGRSGTIVPNDRMGGGGLNYAPVVNISGGASEQDRAIFSAELRRQKAEIADMLARRRF